MRNPLLVMRKTPARRVWPPLSKRHPVLLLVFLSFAVWVGWARLRASDETDEARYHNRSFTCTAVLDGDTLDIHAPDATVQTTRVRLWGVDAPEIAHASSAGMYYGEDARTFARHLAQGRQVRLVLAPERTRDRYGRLLAYVYCESKSGELLLNEELIVTGHAYADRRFRHPWRLRFEQLEERAEKQERGLWGRIRQDQMPPWRQRYLQRAGVESEVPE